MDNSSGPRFSHLLKGTALLLAVLHLGASSVPERTSAPLLFPVDSPMRVQLLESIDSPDHFGKKGGFFRKLVDIIAGPKTSTVLLARPLGVARTPTGQLAVADPGMGGVHLFDPARKKHRLLKGGKRVSFRSPVAVATDRKGRIYVSDSEHGFLFVFNRKGRFEKFIGRFQKEGLFKRATGLAVDSQRSEIYVTDTTRQAVYVVDMQGRLIRRWGERGREEGNFNFPVAIELLDDRVFVLDSLNWRIQVFTREGEFLYTFGKPGLGPGQFYRPRGLAIDHQRRLIYVTDSLVDVVQVFTEQGKLLMAFGGPGSSAGRFQLATGVFIDSSSQVYVSDSLNRRIQVFSHADPRPGQAQGGDRP